MAHIPKRRQIRLVQFIQGTNGQARAIRYKRPGQKNRFETDWGESKSRGDPVIVVRQPDPELLKRTGLLRKRKNTSEYGTIGLIIKRSKNTNRGHKPNMLRSHKCS